MNVLPIMGVVHIPASTHKDHTPAHVILVINWVMMASNATVSRAPWELSSLFTANNWSYPLSQFHMLYYSYSNNHSTLSSHSLFHSVFECRFVFPLPLFPFIF